MNIKKIIICILFCNMAFLQEWNEKIMICGGEKPRRGEYPICEGSSQFLENNWVQGLWTDVIEKAYELILCDCVNDDDENIYILYGRAYDKLEKPDSSTWVFKKGLKKFPDSENLLYWAASSSSKEIRNGNTKKLDEHLYFLERLLEINPENISALERMSSAYKLSEMYEEQIVIIDQLLKIDPGNQQAITDKKKAFVKLGKDASDVDKERWGREPSNLEYGLAYLKSLTINENYELASEISEEILLYHGMNKRLLKEVSNIHIKNLDDKKAIKYLEQLREQNDINTNYLIKLSDAYLNINQYKKAYSSANQAIGLEENNKEAYFQRANVLKNLVDYYASDDLDFCDRLVYELAAEDYEKASKYKHINGKRYKNNLIEGDYITNVGAWHMLGEKFKNINTMSPDNNECLNRKGFDCYSFIQNREVNRKK